MSTLITNLPSYEVWVRKEYLTDHQSGHGEFVKGVSFMATRFNNGVPTVESKPKKSRQGRGKHSKYSPTSRNGAKKKYRGQGK